MAKFRGFFHAHLTWLFDPYTTDYNVYAPDLLQDRLIVWLTRSYWFWPALFLALAYAYGYLLGDSRAGVASVLLGGCLATTVSHNLTWGLNSIAHYYGRQTYPRKDESRNNWIMGWLTMGEGWHNNHHAFPRTPFLGHGPDEVDWNGAVIRLLERLGVIRHVVRMGDRRR